MNSLSELHRAVVFGQSGGRVIWQPRIQCWDGDVRPILKYARETGLDGIEAITPRPQGDVTLEEIKDALGDDLFLVDGIPAIFFDTMFPVEDLVGCVRKLLELFAPKLVLGISDELSSTGDFERVRLVGDLVEQYNTRFD